MIEIVSSSADGAACGLSASTEQDGLTPLESELLHALQCARIKLSRYREYHPDTWVGGVLAEYQAVITVADAAIAKAEGRS